MAAVELATGYVTLTVETSSVAGKIGKIFSGAEGTATSAGKNMGKAMAKAFDSEKPDVDGLRADVERAEKRIAAAAEVSARKQEAAKRKVEIAQAKLNETTEKYGAKSSQALTAADRLSTSQQRLDAETLDAVSSQNKLQNELKQSQDALNKAANSSDGASKKYATGWRGIGQKIKAHLTKGVKDAGKAAEKDSKSAGKRSAGGFGSAFKGAMTGALAGLSIGAAIGAGKEWLQDAGALEQSVGAINVIFGKSSAKVLQWSEDAANSLGIAEGAYNESASLFGSLFQNMGFSQDEAAKKTKESMILASDLSAMYGGPVTDAVDALTAARKGEYNQLEKYGVTMNETIVAKKAEELGFKKVGKTYTANQKELAKMAILQEQTAKAQGQFGRETDTFAGKQAIMQANWKNLTTAIGGFFMPVMGKLFAFITEKAIPGISAFFGWLGKTTVVRVLGDVIGNLGSVIKTDVLPFMGQMVKWVKDNDKFMGLLGTVILTTAGALLAAKIAMGIWSTAVKIATGVQAAFNFVMNMNPIMKIVTLIGILVGVIVWLYKNNETARKIIDAVWKGITKGIQAAVRWIVEAFNNVKKWVTVTLPGGFNILRTIVGNVFGKIRSVIGDIWGKVKAVFSAWTSYMKGTLGVGFSLLKDLVTFNFSGMWKTITSVWRDKIKPVFQALGDFIKKNVAPAFKKGVDAVKGFWNGIKKIARDPVVAIVNVVYNNGLKSMFNGISKKLKLGWELPHVTVPQFAKGGWMKKGWKLVGEEGPELINTGPGYVNTAKETKQMLDGKKQLPMEALRQDTPIQAHEGIGGWSDIWGGIKNTFGGVKDWVVGKIGDAVKVLVRPIKDMIGNLLPGGGMNELIRGGGFKLIDDMTGWATKKDDAAFQAQGGESGATYDGPLGPFHRPGGRITSGFGTSRGRYPHAGIDFAVPIGTAVKAMLAGVVRKIGWNAVSGRSGKGLVMSHANGLGSYYGHLSGWKAQPGTTVKAGQTIAYSGNTGKSTGPHLHAELWKNGNPFNFMSYLHDKGGYVMPGKSVIENKTRRPEPVLNESQWSAMMKLADRGVQATTGGDHYTIGEVIIPVRDLAEFMKIADFFESAKRTIRKGVNK